MSAPYYTARCGLVWSPCGPRTVSDAEQHARDFLGMALSERDAGHAADWMRQLSGLVLAIREAKTQAAERPVMADRMAGEAAQAMRSAA